jgi:hypothetical protein
LLVVPVGYIAMEITVKRTQVMLAGYFARFSAYISSSMMRLEAYLKELAELPPKDGTQ